LYTPSGRYTWRSDSPHRFSVSDWALVRSFVLLTSGIFQLYSDDPATETPIAYCRMVHDPLTIVLVLQVGLERELQIEALTSFLVLEQRRRQKERRWRDQMSGPIGLQFIMMG